MKSTGNSIQDPNPEEVGGEMVPSLYYKGWRLGSMQVYTCRFALLGVRR